MATVRVQTEPFDLGAEFTALTAGRTEIGGIGAFVGTVRGGPGELAALTLEHYPAMTTAALTRIVAEAERRWPLLGCTIVHRVGRLCPGDPIVLVLAASAHREPALQATAFLIDYLKTEAPFWKQEQTPDGNAAWVEARVEDHDAAARWSAPPA